MKPSTTVNRLAGWLSWLVLVILVVLPFHAILTVWLSSVLGHYTAFRLWKEFLLVIIVAGCLYILAVDKPLRQKLFAFWPARLIGIYTLVLFIWGFTALALHNVTGKAMWYGLLVNLRFLIFFLAVWVIASKSNWLMGRWRKILLLPALIVAAFAILQYLFLPYDFLRHLGYGPDTIFPYETINHNINHLRVASTTRGANPLGAYLLLPVSALAALYFKDKKQRLNIAMIGFGLVLALIFSYSRSAWIGTLLSVFIICWVLVKSEKTRKGILVVLVVLAAAAAALAISLRNNTTLESVLFHTDHTSTIAESSNEGHSAAFKGAAKDLLNEPLGSGVGTAGPESTYNYGHPGRIAENYFLQIGQEAGLIGMALFILVNAAVGWQLWRRRKDYLALVLFGSLVGLTFINLLSHAWTDDTIAYIWWGLAGIALAAPALGNKNT